MNEKELLLQIEQTKQNIEILLGKLNKTMTEEIRKPAIYLRYLREREKYLEWMLRKYSLQFEGSPHHVFKRDIFYCELGYNLGSEQKEKRPVLILQNDRGNASSSTTIIAPISTHRDSEIFEDKGKTFIRYTNDNGEQIVKKLDYYEIPVGVEEGFSQNIKGYINLAQSRTISMKRLAKSPVAKITIDTEQKLYYALKRLLT